MAWDDFFEDERTVFIDCRNQGYLDADLVSHLRVGLGRMAGKDGLLAGFDRDLPWCDRTGLPRRDELSTQALDLWPVPALVALER